MRNSLTVDLTSDLTVDLTVDLTFDLSSESVKVSRGQLRSVSLSLAIHQRAGNTESYKWDGLVTEGQPH